MTAPRFELPAESPPTDAELRERLFRDETDAVAWAMLADRTVTDGRADEAVRYYQLALTHRPRFWQAWTNLGNALIRCHRYADALKALQRALDINPTAHTAAWNRSNIRLLLGDYYRGWSEYELRWVALDTPAEPSRQLTGPPWRGESLAGKTLLVCAEQGAGDTLMMARYLPRLATQAREVIAVVQKPLHRLLGQMPGIRVLSHGAPWPRSDCWVPMMSLPYRCRTLSLDAIPWDGPYLHAPASGPRVPERPGLRVGFLWAGTSSHVGDRERSTTIEQWRPLWSIPGTAWYSLQNVDWGAPVRVGSTLVDPRALAPITDVMGAVKDFADTAHLIGQLDLVVGVDTSPIHLAGAMGKETWVMVGEHNDWRWGLERTDSPWYPESVTVFRQAKAGDWAPVLRAVGEAIRARVAQPQTQEAA